MATINGTDGDDELTGTTENDRISGLDGNDRINASPGADILDGGAGMDTLVTDGADVSVDLAAGTATTRARPGRGFTFGFNSEMQLSSFENLSVRITAPLTQQGLRHQLTGDHRDNRIAATLSGNFDALSLSGGGGDDVLVTDGLRTGDLFNGGAGNDTLSFELSTSTQGARVDLSVTTQFSSIENLIGTAGRDTLIGSVEANRLEGRAGDDVIASGGGEDRAFGGAGNDLLGGGDARDALAGGDGADFIGGENGDDVISGGAGLDRLFGDAGADLIGGGEDPDGLFGQDGDDFMGGEGGDDFLTAAKGVTVFSGMKGTTS